MTIELRTMRYVIAVADAGGFLRAAEHLHMAQPPLSRQIRELERELGVALFHRRPTRLTASGRVFVDAARAVLADVDDAIASARRAGGSPVGVVRVGYGPMSGHAEIPRLAAAVQELHPGVQLVARELWDTELSAALLRGELDVVIGRHLFLGGDVARHTLRREDYVVVVDEDHRLAGRSAVALRDLRDETFRFLPRHFAPRYYDAVLRALHSTGERFAVWENPIPGLRNYGDLRGSGFMFLPSSIGTSLPAGLSCLAVTDELPTVDLEIHVRPAAGEAVEGVVRVAQALGRHGGWGERPRRTRGAQPASGH